MTDFATYAESVIAELKGQNKLKAAESRRFISSSFIRFMGDDIIPMERWDDRLMLEYQTWLQQRGLSPSTRAFYMSQMSAFCKKAVSDGLSIQSGIFRLVRRASLAKRTDVKVLTIEELRRMRDLQQLTKVQVFARDIFFFSIYARGMNFVDIAYLKKDNVKDGILTYVPHSFEDNPSVSMPWDSSMQEIADSHPTDSEYLFPLITKTDAAGIYGQIIQTRQNVLRNLRNISMKYHFSAIASMSMTKELYKRLMDEVMVSKIL